MELCLGVFLLGLEDFAELSEQLNLGCVCGGPWEAVFAAAMLCVVHKKFDFFEQHTALIGAGHFKVELDRLILKFFQDFLLVAAVTEQHAKLIAVQVAQLFV